MHELDKPVTWKEIDISSFFADDSIGEYLADTLMTALEEYGYLLPRNATYLGLAAGQAYPEMSLAKNLGIPHNKVTLIDRDFSHKALERHDAEFPEVTLINEGLFSYLSEPTQRKFSLVSVIGLEYVLRKNTHMQTLISLLPNVLCPQGLALIHLYEGPVYQEIWERFEFEKLLGHELRMSSLLYLFKGKSGTSRYFPKTIGII